MKTEILNSPGDVAARAADLVAAAVAAQPSIVLALPTGRTPVEMYRILAERRRTGALNLDQATSFNLDEVLLPKSSPQTFFQFMTRHAWGPLGISEERRFIPDSEAGDPEAECLRYETEIAAGGGLDLAVLGVGADGHIAYNLPGQVKPRTHVVSLDRATVATLGGNLQGAVRAITMGVETILSARRILLLATGSSKAVALRRMRDDPPGDAWPCTLFRHHQDLTLIMDSAAASQL